MSTYVRCIVVLSLLPIAGACDRSSSATPNATRDSSDVAIVESATPQVAEGGADVLLTIEPRAIVAIGRDDEAGDSLSRYQLHRVTDAVRLADGSIAVSNSGTNEIRIFDSAGVFQRTVGRKGAGPGEFGEYSSARLFPGRSSILADDNGAFRLHAYSNAFEFVDTRNFALGGEVTRPFMRGLFEDGSWLALSFAGGGALRGPVGSVIRSQYTLLHFDSAGRLLNEVAKLDAQPRYVHEFAGRVHYPFIPLSSEPLDATIGNEVVIHRGPKPELEVFDQSGKLIRVIRWSRALKPVKDVWSAYQAAALADMSERQKASYAHLYSLELPLPEFTPSYSEMVVDENRNVWLKRFQIDGDPAAPTWDVISRAGQWIGVATTPSRFNVYRIGSNYLLGRSRDSLDVERVELRRTTSHSALVPAKTP